jgi:hypothetical protein
MNETPLQEHLRMLWACSEAREWVGELTALQAWKQCQRADWLLWWAARTKANERTAVVLAACACARTALRFVPKGEERPRLAIEAAEAWAKAPTPGSREKARAAAHAAYAAADYAAAAHAADAGSKAHLRMCRLIRKLLICPWTEPKGKDK